MELIRWDDEPLRPVIEDLFRSLDPALLVSNSIILEDDHLRVRGIEAPGWDLEARMGRTRGRMAIIAVGKAAPRMIEGALSVLERSHEHYLGPLLCLSPHRLAPEKMHIGVTYLQGDHPLPGPGTASNVRTLLGAISELGGRDNVLFLLSGGASALTFSPAEGIDASFKSRIIGRLLHSGASIEELNLVRRCMSATKGGGLLKDFKGAQWTTIALSDVMSDDPRFVGSGLTYPWTARSGELALTISKYCLASDDMDDILGHCSKIVYDRELQNDLKVSNVLVANNSTAVRTLSSILSKNGVSVKTPEGRFVGDAGTTARTLLEEARASSDSDGPTAFIKGGEATVEVKGKGRGGRCSEMALTVLPLLVEGEMAAFLTTDGADGDWDGGGAIARNCQIDDGVIHQFLKENDSGTFFDLHGGKVSIGPTMNNLGDIFIFIRSRSGGEVLPARVNVLDGPVDIIHTLPRAGRNLEDPG